MKTISRRKLSKTLGIIQWILLIIFYLFAASQIKAQPVVAEVYAQQSIIGVQKGYAVKYATQKGFGFGVFHQSSNNLSFETKRQNYPFSGVEVEVPLTTCGKIQISVSEKVGFVNRKYLILTPEITTRVAFGKILAIGLGAGYRAGQTALALKVNIKTSGR